MSAPRRLVNLEDAQLEREIAEMREKMVRARRSDVARVYQRAMCDLIALRSPQRVREMEERKGLL